VIWSAHGDMEVPQSGVLPRLARRGKICAAIATQIGAVGQSQTNTLLSTLIHRPASLGGGFAKFLEVARSAPPGQAGRRHLPAGAQLSWRQL
jgi:hypothetical protein